MVRNLQQSFSDYSLCKTSFPHFPHCNAAFPHCAETFPPQLHHLPSFHINGSTATIIALIILHFDRTNILKPNQRFLHCAFCQCCLYLRLLLLMCFTFQLQQEEYETRVLRELVQCQNQYKITNCHISRKLPKIDISAGYNMLRFLLFLCLFQNQTVKVDNGPDLIGVSPQRRRCKSSCARAPPSAAGATAVNVGTVVVQGGVGNWRLMADNWQLDMGNNIEWQPNSSLSDH